MRLIDRVRTRRPKTEERFGLNSLSDLVQWMNTGNGSFPFGYQQTLQGNHEPIEPGYANYAQQAYAGCGVVFAVSLARILLFSEARFQWQRLSGGRPGDLFGDSSLALLEYPDWNVTTGELLTRMDQDVTLAGNWFATITPGGPTGRRLRRLRPDWVTIVVGSQADADDPLWQLDAEVIGYAYTPGGARGRAHFLLREEVAHYSPYPDPLAAFRGMSWITPLLREIESDVATTVHKGKYFANGATPNMVISPTANLTEKQFKDVVASFRAQHEGVANAYKTVFLGGGADVKVVGSDLKQLDFRLTQNAGETRICAAGGVPAVIVGLSEGLQAATYSNFQQARRKFADHWARPAWRGAAAALQTLMTPPPASRLWYDDRDIPMLRDDEGDLAKIRREDAGTVRTLLDAGYHPDAAIDYVLSGDLNRLRGQHSGLFSVQLQPPGTTLALPGGTSAQSSA